MKGETQREEVERSASLEKTGEGVGIRRDVGAEHRGVGEKKVAEGPRGRETVEDGVA